jgi:ribosomal protein S3
MSLRLKKSNYWGNTSYYFNTKSSLNNYWGVDKIALNVIKHYFQFALISKPKFNKDSNKIVISFYYFLNLPVSKRLNPYGQSKRIQSSLQEGLTPLRAIKFSSLILKLSSLYGKPVEIRPVRIHYPYLNSYILAQYIALNIKAGRFNMVSRNLFKKAKLVKNNYITTNKSRNSFNNFIKYSQNFLNPQYITGIKLQISGRLSNRKAASRTRVVRKSIGTLSLNSNNSLIDANKFSFKGKNGAITVKVWISSCEPIFSNVSVSPKINTPLFRTLRN